MFKGGSYNKAHWYLVYNNKKDGVYAKQITHIYVPDPKRFEKIRKGYIIKARVKGFYNLQGIKDTKIKYDVNGNKLTNSIFYSNNIISDIPGKGYVRKIK